MGGRLIVQGTGADDVARPLRAIAASAPGRFALVERFDRAMARRIYAGADLFLMPSRFEPCGQGQMIAMRYGTAPVVHRTGGLADTVTDEPTRPGRGTGFVFEHATVEGLVWAIGEAFAVRGDGTTPRWLGLRERAMAVDHDWRTGSAPAYLRLYEEAIADRRAALSAAPRARRRGKPPGASAGGSAGHRRS
jgi:starch synthase